MKKLCLFDLDGTIIDPFISITSGVQYGLRDQGVIVTDLHELTYFIGPPIRDSLRTCYPSFTDEQVEKFVVKYREYFAMKGYNENKLYPGVINMLNQLKDAGLILTIATSKYKESAKEIARLLEFESYFDLIVGCEFDGTRSLKADVIAHVLKEADPRGQYSPVMIGDRKYDIIGANACGIESIGVTWGYGSREELESEKPAYVVDSVEELTGLLLA